MWAIDGSVTLTQSKVYFLRQKGDAGLYINVTSENATYLSSTGSPLVSINQGGGNIHVSDFGLYTQTYTLAMPSNYTITSYVLTVTPAANQTLVVGNGTADVTTLAQNTKTTITVSGVNAYSTTFQFMNNGGNGYNYIESIVVNYSYTTTPTIVHTMDDLECADYSDCPTYTLDCQRSTLYAESNILTTVHAIEYSGGTPVDANKAFAFIKNTSTGAYYLYHVATGKFVTGNGNKQLSTTPTDAVNLYWTLNFSYPAFVKLGSNFINVQTSGGSSGGVLVNGYATADGGNSIAISPAGTADLTRAYKIVNGWTATYHISGTSLTATGNLTFNGALSLPGTLKRAYCTYKYYSDAECEHEITTANDVYDDIYVKYTVSDCPFEFSSEEGITPNYVYYLLRTYNNNFLYSNESSIAVTTTANTANEYQWAIVGNPYAYTIKNKATGTYIVASFTNNGEATLGGTGTSFGLYSNTQVSDNHFTAITKNGNNDVILQNHPVAGSGIRCYNGTGDKFTDDVRLNNLAGAFFVPYSVVTYNLIWNESTIYSVEKGVIVGNPSADNVPWTKPAFSSFSYDVSTVTKTTTEVNVTLNWDGPFEFSNSFNDATWYNLKINGDYLIYASTGNYNLVSNISSAESAGYNAFWGFIGNPVDGVQIINKSAGEGKSLAPFTTPSMAQGEFSWAVRQWDENFSLDWSYNYLNNVDGVFKLYNSSTTPDDPTNFGCSVESASYRGVALAYVDEYANSHALGQYFGVSTASYNYIKNTITNASSVSESDYSDLELNISTYLSLLYPSTGYYRIKNNATGSYIAYGQPAAPYVEKTAGLIAISADKVATDFSAIIKLTGSNGTYKLSTEGRNVQPQTTGSQAFPATESEGVDFVFNIATPGIVSITNAASRVSDDQDGSLHHATGWTVDGIVNWSASADNSKWILEDVNEMTVPLNGPINDNYYATLYLPFDVTISGATAYTLAQDENYLTPTEVEDNKVPAGTPVILKGSSSSATATTNTGDAFNSGSPLSCALTGTYANITIDTRANSVGNYVFGTNGSNVGFYHVKNENFSLKAYRAYLHLGSDISSTGCRIVFDDVVTGIVAPIGDTEEDTIIYNLSGQRLNKMQKGINIVNGKKVLF